MDVPVGRIAMNYEALTTAYWQKQAERVLGSRARLAERASATGRVVPEGEDLALGTGRRMSMAIMFLDISGFSSRPSETVLEQDQLLSALNLFFTEMIRVAEDYGGSVEKNTGDGLMAYFEDRGGDPPEDGCKRAVACALTMMAAGDSLINPVLRSSNIQEIPFRIAIDYGFVTVARLGAPRRFNAVVAVGTTANVASKMLGFVGAGQIAIGEAVRARLPAAWQLSWTELLTASTGWEYRLSRLPYTFHRYTGRWSRLT